MTATLPAGPAQADPRRPHLIAAGPGTGKTSTMVERYRWLVEHERLAPESILAVTFTDAAASEWRQRLERELGRPLEAAPIGTFHAICSRLLQEHAYEIGVPRELRALDEVDQRLLQQGLVADLQSGAAGRLPEDLHALQPDDIEALLRRGPTFALRLKGRGVGPGAFLTRARARHQEAWGERANHEEARAELESIQVLHAVYSAYEERLEEVGRLDFDDLLLRVTDALEQFPGFADSCHRRFAHILVDEFQDTNRLQLELIRRLAAPGFGNVTAVGDEKQSIYGWRDADIANIQRGFPGERLPLVRNWRSRQEVLDVATDFIRRDPLFEREPSLVAERGAGGRCVSLLMAPDARTEAEWIVRQVRQQVAAGRRPGSIAILATSVRRLPADFEEQLRLQGVPYVTSAGSGFFDREEVKDMLALLRLVSDPMDDGALVRVLQGPLVRLGDRVLYRLAHRRLVLQDDGISLYRESGVRLRDCVERARGEGWPELSADQARRVEETLKAADDLSERADTLSIAELLQEVLDRTGYLRHATLRSRREGPRALRNLHKVVAMASRFESQQTLAGVSDFVARMQAVMEATVPVAEAGEEAADAVHLLTVHAAKGLEFESVFLAHLERPYARESGENFFFDPETYGFVMKWWHGKVTARYDEHTPNADSRAQQLGERRRVVYVALTRARDELTVSATREELGPEDVDVQIDDHFAELLQWAVVNPEAARVVTAEQLDLPGSTPAVPPPPASVAPDLVPRLVERVERLRALSADTVAARAATAGRPGPVRLTFSQLHTLELCPVRYRYAEVWRLPEPPDELRWQGGQAASGAAHLGSAVHEALAAAHYLGGSPLDHYTGPDGGREMLERYATDPLAGAPTLGVEVEFNLLLESRDGGPGVRLAGIVDRICEEGGRTVLIDYKTNARLDPRLQAAYEEQLRLYGLAAVRGLLPGRRDVDLVLYDLRQGRQIPVLPDPAGAESRALAAAGQIASGDFRLGPEHRNRPCSLCAYRPICPDRR